ncbi:MAG: glyoxalase III HchA [Pseudomonadota bacterium]|nr:glyoxalase III HchA [Pseudomonadota bacterium]
MSELTLSLSPTPDPAEHNAFFPSPHSLSQFTSPKSNLSDTSYPQKYTGKTNKILVIAADERYLLMQDGSMFSTGNHPVETLLPMYHLDQAGFEFEIATLSGNPAKFELWAMPNEDEQVRYIYEKYLPQFRQPKALQAVIDQQLGDDSDFAAVFIPGGHGALIGIPFSPAVKQVLVWAHQQDKFVISLCHGPAGLLAAGIDEDQNSYIYSGYKICAFPDAADKQTPDIGYMPSQLPWFFGEKLAALGVEIVNQDITGQCIQDRKLITGDSPFAANEIGKLSARALLKAFAVI